MARRVERRKRKPVTRIYKGGWKSEGVEDDLDPGVNSLIRDLNFHGYRTTASCEGGKGAGLCHEYNKGWISLAEKDLTKVEKEEIASIIKQHTDVPFWITKRGDVFFTRPIVNTEVNEGPWVDYGLFQEYDEFGPSVEVDYISEMED